MLQLQPGLPVCVVILCCSRPHLSLPSSLLLLYFIMGDAAKGAKIFKTKCAQCKEIFEKIILIIVNFFFQVIHLKLVVHINKVLILMDLLDVKLVKLLVLHIPKQILLKVSPGMMILSSNTS